MALIITHPGSAHLDDFLSCCLVVNKNGNIKKIKRKEPNKAEIKDPAIWKLDVGGMFDPDIKCFDHHQDGMDEECTLSLLLKNWGLWSIANEVHKWLKIVVINDTIGPKEITKQLKISFKAMGALNSFVERTILDFFNKQKEIEKESLLFSLMEIIGQNFFALIDEYTTIMGEVKEKLKYKIINGVQSILFYKNLNHSSTLIRIIKDKMKEKWPDLRGGIAVYPNKRVKGTLALKRFDDDERVDFSRISHYEKVVYSHPKGFFVSVRQMTEDQLVQYIKGAIKK
jgi:hypothetical protein